MSRYAAALLLAFACVMAAAQAPANPPLRIRGIVQTLEGTAMTVKTHGGEALSVTLADNYSVMGIARAGMADIASGGYIGTTTVGVRDGALVALEVHIFPDAMRGTGEGHRDWDLRPGRKMTNASVASITSMGDARMLTVQYKGGEQKILVPAGAAVVKFAPVERSALKPGAPVFMIARRRPDGSLFAPRVNVGLDGQVPPM
jgi:hypothetical protein